MKMGDAKKGERCIVTGDSADWGHRFYANMEVVLAEPHDREPAWRCAPADDPGGEDWWVHAQDLTPANIEPTDEEIRQAFGLDPRVCTACGCTCGGGK